MTPRDLCDMRVLVLITIILVYRSDCHSDYKTNRAKILHDEDKLTLGGNITLTQKEIEVNNCLMKHKNDELNYAFDHPEYFNFSYHFFKYKDGIKNSKVYQIIKDLPKGAALHLHDVGLLGPDYLLNITYMDGLYVCFDNNNKVLLKFSKKAPDANCDWKLMRDVRKTTSNVKKFDAELRKHFTIVVDDPAQEYPCIKNTWYAFMNYFTTVFPMLTYRPVWEQYFYDVLKTFREDNIMYVEVRTILPPLYELDGTVYDPVVTAKAYQKIASRFVKEHPDFIGAKVIYAPSREIDTDGLNLYLQVAKRIKAEVLDFFAGFDLVGQEDAGKPLLDFVPQLSAANDLTYFFHAGETDWYGTSTDENLIDAILLGAKRLGHAYALPKHPLLIQEVLKRDIGLEVNVISNAVLSLVQDVRNHPLASFFAHGMPVVLSSDDPGAWEADPLSDDFYVAFMGVASKTSDLRLLKQLAVNSLKYSALEGEDKTKAFVKFNTKWDNFVNNFKCSS